MRKVILLIAMSVHTYAMDTPHMQRSSSNVSLPRNVNVLHMAIREAKCCYISNRFFSTAAVVAEVASTALATITAIEINSNPSVATGFGIISAIVSFSGIVFSSLAARSASKMRKLDNAIGEVAVGDAAVAQEENNDA
jgi:hypothetical protein